MNPDPPFTATQIYLSRRVWLPGIALLVLVVLALIGLVDLVSGAGPGGIR
jgi:hypothetical protein